LLSRTVLPYLATISILEFGGLVTLGRISIWPSTHLFPDGASIHVTITPNANVPRFN
jgi:hypothetical protein